MECEIHFRSLHSPEDALKQPRKVNRGRKNKLVDNSNKDVKSLDVVSTRETHVFLL